VTIRRRATTLVVAVVLGLIAIPAPAHAAGPAADITIRSVRLTDRLVLRIDATYVCPPGFAVELSRLPQAFAGQQGGIGASSQYKRFGDIVCDGSTRDVLVRFVRPRHPQGATWEFDALTQVSLTFQARMTEAPYSTVTPSDVRMVMTRAAAHADMVADIAIERVSLSDRQALRVRATYRCPVGLAVNPALPPRAVARQETAEHPLSQKTFDGIVCDGTRRAVVVRFARPRQPDGAQWRAGVLTDVLLTFQASTESPYRFVLATDAQSSRV
jgi:hypothetical protein